MEDLAPLGQAVRRARLGSGLTLKDLAARSSLSVRFLSDLERGKGNISIGRLMQVARALGVRLKDLVAVLDAPNRARIVALVGLRGAGKTTVGRGVAEVLDYDFVELDERIETAAGLPLSQIFEIHGEDYYRRLEREVLEGLLQEPGRGVILTTGGGIVTATQTWSILKARTLTAWLQAHPEDHYQRVMAQGDLRPMKNRPSAMAELRALLEIRGPLYAEAELHVHTSMLPVDALVQSLSAQIRPCE